MYEHRYSLRRDRRANLCRFRRAGSHRCRCKLIRPCLVWLALLCCRVHPIQAVLATVFHSRIFVQYPRSVRGRPHVNGPWASTLYGCPSWTSRVWRKRYQRQDGLDIHSRRYGRHQRLRRHNRWRLLSCWRAHPLSKARGYRHLGSEPNDTSTLYGR